MAVHGRALATRGEACNQLVRSASPRARKSPCSVTSIAFRRALRRTSAGSSASCRRATLQSTGSRSPRTTPELLRRGNLTPADTNVRKPMYGIASAACASGSLAIRLAAFARCTRAELLRGARVPARRRGMGSRRWREHWARRYACRVPRSVGPRDKHPARLRNERPRAPRSERRTHERVRWENAYVFGHDDGACAVTVRFGAAIVRRSTA